MAPEAPRAVHSSTARRRLQRAGLVVAGVLGVLAVAIIVCESIEWPFLRRPVEREMAQVLHRDVHIGAGFGVRLFGHLRAHADDLVIGSGPGVPSLLDDAGQPRDFMHARQLRLELTYAALWHQWRGTGEPLSVRLLQVDGLELNLKRDADGQANWAFGSAAAASAPAASQPRMPTFERLEVQHGDIRLLDEPTQLVAEAQVATNERGAAWAHAPLPADSSAAALAMRAAAAASSAESPATPASASPAQPPGLSIDAKGSFRHQPLVMQFRSSGLMPLASSDASTPPVPLWLEIHAGKSLLRLDGQGSDLLHFGGLDATFKGEGPSLAAVGDAIGVTLPTTPPFATHGRVRKRGNVWGADIAALDIGSSRLRGDFQFDSAAAVPKLTGTLAGSRLALADLGPAFGTSTTDQPKQTSTGHVLPEREFDIPSLRAMEAEVGVALDTVDLGTDKLEPFHPLRGHISLEGGVLRLDDLLARTSEGQVAGTIGLDSRPALPRWDATLRWTGIRLERFVKTHDMAARKAGSMAQTQGGYIGGALGGVAQLRGTGKSTAALLGSLDGSTRMWVRDGHISHLLLEGSGIDIAQAIGVYFKGDDAIPMRCAVASLQLARGKVLPDVAVIDTHDTTLLVGGEISLADETLSLKVTAEPHDFSPLALRAPINVDGTFAAPHVHLEAKPLERKAGIAVALAAINPLAAVLALLDWRKPEKDVCTAAVSQVAGAAQAGVRASAPAGAASDAGLAAHAAQVRAQARTVRTLPPPPPSRTLVRPAAPTHP